MKNFRSSMKYRGTQCLNCEHSLDKSDQYCPNCGQVNSTKKLSFSDFFNEFFAGLFAYDSRIRRTFNTLLFHPGKISRDYIKGKRMRYANPFRFYLSASIIFFILWNFTNSFEGFTTGLDTGSVDNEELTGEQLEDLRRDLQKIPTIDSSPIPVDSVLLNRMDNRSKSYQDFYVSEDKMDSLGLLNSFTQQVKLYDKFYKETNIQDPVQAVDSLSHENSTYNEWLYSKVVDFNFVKSNPKIFFDYFLSKLPFIIFFYLPVFALFIWLLYIRRPFNYMEHLIFTFHIQTTFFVLMGFSMLLDFIFRTDMLTGIMIIVFLFYLYKAMRNFYLQGRFKSLVKFILLNVIFLILAIIATIFSLMASFAIY